MNILELGAIFLIAGGLIWGIIRLLLILLPRWRTRRLLDTQPRNAKQDAVIIVEQAGRVHSINEETRLLFGLGENEHVGLNYFVNQLSPSDDFLSLCVNEGRGRLRLVDGTLVEVRSSRVQVDRQQYQVLNLYPIEVMETLGVSNEGNAASQDSLQSILDISKHIHVSHELDETVHNILDEFRQFIPAEYVELTLLDIDAGKLTAFQFIGRPGETAEFRRYEHLYTLDGTDPSFASYIFETRNSLMVNNIPLHRELQTNRERNTYPFNSYLGVPLLREQSLIGTLSFAVLKTYGFSEQNRRLLETFSEHIGIAIYNAQEFERQNRLAIEQAVTSKFSDILSDETLSTNLYERLVNGIAGLVNVDLVGFLIYNPEWNVLQGQNPFYGLSEQIVELYQVEVAPQSQGARLVESKQTLIFHQAPDDPGCRALGIDHLARAAGLQDLALLPLLSGGQFFGYLQAAWHATLDESVLRERLHLLSMIVKQATPAIENRLLIERSRERANRAETLQRIAASANAASDVSTFQHQALDTIVRLVNGDLILLLELNKEFSHLRLADSRKVMFSGDLSRVNINLPIQDAQYSMTVTARMQPIYCDDLHEQLFLDQSSEESPQLIPYYLTLLENLDIRSAIAAPITIRGSGIGEIWVLSENPRNFGRSDLQTLQTATNQIASFLDRMRLYAETDLSLRKQVEHLTILRRITNELSNTLDFDHLLEMLQAQAMRITNVQRGTILMYDLKYFFDERPRIEKCVGEPAEDALAYFERLALDAGKPLYVADLQEEYPDHNVGLDFTSVLLVPIFYQDRPAGMLVLRSKTPRHFDDLMLEIMESVAAQAAIAIGNAIQYDRQKRRGVLLRRELDTIENLRDCFSETMHSHNHQEKLQSTTASLQKATPFKLVVLSTFDEELQQMQRRFVVGNLENGSDFSRQEIHDWYEVQKIFSSELMISNSYYVTENRVPVVIEPVHMQEIRDLQDDQRSLMGWRKGEIFLNIMRDEQERPLGMIQLDCPDDLYRPDQPAMDALELFGAFTEYLMRTDDTLKDTQEALQIVQSALTQKEGQVHELSIERNALNQQRNQLEGVLNGMNRISGINQCISQVVGTLSQVRTDSAALDTLAHEILVNFEADTVLIAGNLHGEEQLLTSVGILPESGTLEPLFGQRNPLRETLLIRKAFAEPALSVNSNWQTSMLLRLFKYESFVSLPISIGTGYNIAVLILYPHADGYLTCAEDSAMVETISRNLGLELSNIHTLESTREQVENLNVLLTFSQKLSSVGPSAIMDILVESVFDTLPAVEGCWVGLEDRHSQRLLTVNARGYTHPESLLEISANIEGNSLPAQVFNSGKARRIGELDFAEAYPMSQEELLQYREATGGMLPISTMIVPITLGMTTMGVIVLDNFHDVNAFSEDDEAILGSMGQQTALVLENSELYQQALHRAEQLQALSTAVQEVTSAPLRSGEMLERILEQTRLVVDVDHAAVWVADQQQMTRRLTYPSMAKVDQSGSSIPLHDTAHSLRSVTDLFEFTYLPRTIPADPRFGMHLFDAAYETHLAVPLIARSELLGVLVIENKQSDAYGGGESQVVQAYALQAAVSFHNALMYEESMQRAQELNLQSDRLSGLNEFALQIGGMTNLEQIYDVTLQTASSLLNAPVIAFVQVSRFDHMMLIAQKPEYELSFTEELTDVPLLAGLRQSRAIYTIPDVAGRDDLGILKEAYLAPLDTHSLLIVPVVAASQFWGWMWVQSPEINAFDDRSMEIAHLIANHVAIAIVNATTYYETRVMRENLEQRVEERTSELERGLEEFEMLNNNLQAILSSMADGVLVTNDHGKVVLTNPAASNILHLEPGLLQGMDAGQLPEQLQAEESVEWFKYLAEWTADTPPAPNVGIYSQRVQQEDGHILFIQGSAVLREEGYLGSVTILRDITAEAMAERLKSEFVTNVSHELRTPITAIKGAVEVVLGQMTGSLNQQQEMFMTMARKNCDRLQVLIDDILEVSQIDAGQMELNFRMMDTAAVVAEVIEDFERRSRIGERKLRFDVDLPGQLPQIEGDPQRVRQILENLFSNAFRYTEDNGRILARVRQRGNYLQIDVEDNGIGIPPEAASRVFERFYRGEDELVIQSAGPGLGLWITKTLVEMHGGEIWFASSGIPGEGTTFSFTLPVRREGIIHG